MKLQGIVGTGSGKMGASVFAVRNGVQIVRQYQGLVINPKTPAQIEQRAKLKLTSQVAAALGPIIMGFRGMNPGVSQRNAFVSDLFKRGAITYNSADSKAVINVSAIKLTNSSLVMGNTSNISATGSSVTATVYPAPEFRAPGSMLMAVVIRPIQSGGVEYIGTQTVESASTIELTVQTVGPVMTGDRLIVYMTRPDQNEAYTSYMNAIGDAATGDISLQSIVRAYAKSMVYSSSNNFGINVA